MDGVVTFDTKYLNLSVPQLLVAWLKERVALEKRSLAYRIVRQQSAIDYSKLLIFAANKLDVIFKALKAPDSKGYLVKALKLTDEQAGQILDLKVRQLSKLDQDALKVKLADQQSHMKQLLTWQKAPKPKILADAKLVLDAIAKDKKFEAEKGRKMSVS